MPKRARKLDAGRGAGWDSGFTLLEAIVVVVIMLVVLAMALPSLMRAVKHYQSETDARNIADMLSQARTEAVRQNKRISTIFVAATGKNGDEYGIDLNGNGALDSTEPTSMMASGITFWQNNTPALPANTNLPADYSGFAIPPGSGFTPGVPGPPSAYSVTFSADGTVVAYNSTSSTWALATSVWGIVISNATNIGDANTDTWLICVTPAARIRIFYWQSGTGWVAG